MTCQCRRLFRSNTNARDSRWDDGNPNFGNTKIVEKKHVLIRDVTKVMQTVEKEILNNSRNTHGNKTSNLIMTGMFYLQISFMYN